MIDIICWKWKPLDGFRTEFKGYHVNVLYDMIKRNTTIPFNFTCITDDPEGINPEINIMPLWDDCKDMVNPKNKKKPSCYRRLKAFSKDIPFKNRIVSIDLDCVIVGNIDDILLRTEDFICLKGTARKTAYNGGFWSLKVGSRPQVWDTFDPENSPKLTIKEGMVGSDQAWISYILGKKEPVYTKDEGVYCFRSDFISNKIVDLPYNAKIVMFQGGEDPWDIKVRRKYNWVNHHYGLSEELPIIVEEVQIPKPIKEVQIPKPVKEVPPKDIKTPQFSCITFLWGNEPYNYDYVNKLFNSIDRHLSYPHKNICFTNLPNRIREGIEIKPLTTEGLLKNLKKAEQFNPNNGLTGRVLSFDLDNVIIDNIDKFAESGAKFIICEAYNRNRKGLNGGNIMSFDSGYGENIWNKLNTKYNFFKKKTKGLERFLYDRLIKNMEFWPKGWVLSYKHHVMTGKGNLSKAKIISCHGTPNPRDIKDPIITKNWR